MFPSAKPGFSLYAGYAYSKFVKGRNGKNEWKGCSQKLFLDPYASANPHIIISGASGYGKSTLLKSFLIDMGAYGMPALIFDGHDEHKELVASLGGAAYEAGISGINIFSNPSIERLEELTALFSNVYSLGYLQENLLYRILKYAYRKAGNSLDINSVLSEIAVFMKNSKSATELQRLDHLMQRMESLKASLPYSYVPISSLHGLVSFSMLSLKSSEAKLIYLNELASAICRNMYSMEKERGLKMYIVIDESRELLEKAGRLLCTLMAESRKFGLGIILVCNDASVLPNEVTENAASIIAFRSSNPSSLNFISGRIAGGGMQEIREELGRLGKHNAIVASPTPFIAAMPTPEDIAARMRNLSENAPLNARTADTASPANNALLDEIKEYARKPVRIEDVVKKFGRNALGIIYGSAFDTFWHNRLWVTIHSKSESAEHKFFVSEIGRLLSAHGIKFYASRHGPDIVAYCNGKVAIEYETGRKNIEGTAAMLEQRRKSFSLIVIVVNGSHYHEYEKRFPNFKIIKSSSISMLPEMLESQKRCKSL